MNDQIIAGIVGLITGAIGSLIAPWIHWGIEKKRKKHDRRICLINQWREILMSKDFSREDMINNPIYGSLRELLSDQIRSEVERPNNEIVIQIDSISGNYDRTLLLNEVARIEKEWDLI